MRTTKPALTATFMAPTVAPLLDRVGVEAARLVHVGRAALVTEHPSVTYALLAAARNQKEATVRQWALRQRRLGNLVTVDFEGTTLIPSYQFDEAYELVPEVTLVLRRLLGAGMTGWAVWRWFTVVNPWIEERPLQLVAERRFAELERISEKLVPGALPE